MATTTPGVSRGLALSGARDDAPELASAHQETLRLFDAHGRALRRYVQSYGLSADAADDVVQETFLALFRHLSLGRSRENLPAWLFRVAQRTALRHRRRASRTAARERDDSGLADVAAPEAPGADPAQALEHRERRRHLLAVVRALPDRSRQCLALRAGGMKYRDIAAQMKISLGGVAKAIDLAVTRLSNAVRD